MITLENESIILAIDPIGAELKSFIKKQNNTEFLWDSNPEFWAKSSPVLFPIVGGLINNEYHYNNEMYSLGRHGFARESTFEMELQKSNEAIFLLKSSPETLRKYPFEFELRLKYTVNSCGFTLEYEVKNTGSNTMFFSIGAHPAFKIPFFEDEAYSDYYLEFENTENLEINPLTKDGLIENHKIKLSEPSNTLKLSKELFFNDALVFKGLSSSWIKIKSTSNSQELRFNMANFPYLGIWAAKKSNFVCIEPWCGIADHVGHSQKIEEKEGILCLKTSETFIKEWSVSL
jgi:galactose mutarotase-like enzyme